MLFANLVEIYIIMLISSFIEPIEPTSQISSVWLPADATSKPSPSYNIHKRRGDFIATSAGQTAPHGMNYEEFDINQSSMVAASSLQPSIVSLEPTMVSNRSNIRRSDQFNNMTSNLQSGPIVRRNNGSVNEQVQFDEEHFINLANFLNDKARESSKRREAEKDELIPPAEDLNHQRPNDSSKATNSSQQVVVLTSQTNFEDQESPIASGSNGQDSDNDMNRMIQSPDLVPPDGFGSSQYRGRQKVSSRPYSLTDRNNSWSRVIVDDISNKIADERQIIDSPTTTTQEPLIYYHLDGDKWNQVATTKSSNFPHVTSIGSGSSSHQGYGMQDIKQIDQSSSQRPQSETSKYHPLPNKFNELEYEKLRRRQILRRHLLHKLQERDRLALYDYQSSLSNHPSSYQPQSVMYNVKSGSELPAQYAIAIPPSLTSMHTSKRHDYPLNNFAYNVGLNGQTLQPQWTSQQQPIAQRRRQQLHQTSQKQSTGKKWFFSTLSQKLNPWAGDINSQEHDNPRATLEGYFFNEKMPQKPEKRRNKHSYQQPQVAAIYPVTWTTDDFASDGTIRQPMVPRAPYSQVMSYRPGQFASHSLSQAAVVDPSGVEDQVQQPALRDTGMAIRPGQLEANKNTGAASFIPVVAVSVTKTSPAPKAEEQSSNVEDDQSAAPMTSDLDEYLDRKFGSQRGTIQGSLRQQFNPEEYGNSASGSQRQQAINRQSIRPIFVSPDRSTTTVKSAVFGYLPNQLDRSQANPFMGVLNQAFNPHSIGEYNRLSDANLGGTPERQYAYGLSGATYGQNDILHPFHRNSQKFDWASSGLNHLGSNYRAQQTPYNLLASINPLLSTDQSAMRTSYQNQLLAMPSDLNPMLPTFMLTPTISLDSHNSETQSVHSAPPDDISEKNTIGVNANSPISKTKKRSSDFFANAGQLLLSALPLLLAPTLGLMLTSGSNLPTVSRNRNPLTQASASQPAIPSNYINSLSSGLITTPQYFTTTPSSYSHSSINQSFKPTGGKKPKIPSLKQVNNADMNETAIRGSKNPAAIVITTSTTSSPHYSNFNDSYSSDISRMQTQTQSITAVDSLSVHSNQTLVLIPPETHQTPMNQGNASDQAEVTSLSNSDSFIPSHHFDTSTHINETLTPKKQTQFNSHGSTSEHLEGADFDIQYASLENNQTNSITSGLANNSRIKVMPTNRTSIRVDHSHINYDEPKNEDEVSTKLYPVSTWPPLRRRTISLVTSQGNKSFVDSSDKYQASSEFNLSGDSPVLGDQASVREHEQIPPKRTNNRLFRPLLRRNKRDTKDRHDQIEILQGSEARFRGKPASHLITTVVTHLNDEGDDGRELDPQIEANIMRNELLSKKVLLDRVASSQSVYGDNRLRSNEPHSSFEDQQSQHFSNGVREKPALTLGPNHFEDSHTNEHAKTNSDERQRIMDLGHRIARDQHDGITSSLDDLLDLSSTEKSISTVDSDSYIIRGGQASPVMIRRRSPDFSRQMRRVNTLDYSKSQGHEILEPWDRRHWNESVQDYPSSMRQSDNYRYHQHQQKPIQKYETIPTKRNPYEPQYSRFIPNERLNTSRKPQNDLRSTSNLTEQTEATFKDSWASSYYHRPELYTPKNGPRHDSYHSSRNYYPSNFQVDHPYEKNYSNSYHYDRHLGPNGYPRMASSSSPPEDFAPTYERTNNSMFGQRQIPHRQSNYQNQHFNHFNPYPLLGDRVQDPYPHVGIPGRYGTDRPTVDLWNSNQTAHASASSNYENPGGLLLAHQAGPLASVASNESHESSTVNEYLKQVQFNDSDRDKLMAR